MSSISRPRELPFTEAKHDRHDTEKENKQLRMQAANLSARNSSLEGKLVHAYNQVEEVLAGAAREHYGRQEEQASDVGRAAKRGLRSYEAAGSSAKSWS